MYVLVEFTYLVFTRITGESYRRRLRSLLLHLCYVFRAPVNSLGTHTDTKCNKENTFAVFLRFWDQLTSLLRPSFGLNNNIYFTYNNTLTTEQLGGATNNNTYITTALHQTKAVSAFSSAHQTESPTTTSTKGSLIQFQITGVRNLPLAGAATSIIFVLTNK